MTLRGVTSLLACYSFLFMTFTGFSLYAAPHCWMAAWLDWSLLGLSKEQLTAVHVIFGFLFTTSGLVHLALNWRPMLGYLRPGQGMLFTSPPFLVTTGFVLLVIGATVKNLPPCKNLIEEGARLQVSWQTEYALPPRGANAELTLEKLFQLCGIDPGKAEKIFKAKNIQAAPGDQILAAARRNRLAPPDLYNLVKNATYDDPTLQNSPLPDFLRQEHESEREAQAGRVPKKE